MSKFQSFMAGTAKASETIRLVVSDRFVGEDGKPEEWEIRALTTKETAALTKRHIDKKTGRYDDAAAGIAVTAASVVYPDLADAELQDSYGVHGAEELLSVMLTAGEFGILAKAAGQASGTNMDEMVASAKN